MGDGCTVVVVCSVSAGAIGSSGVAPPPPPPPDAGAVITNVTNVDPVPYVAVSAAVAVIEHVPALVKASTPVEELTVQPVVPAEFTE